MSDSSVMGLAIPPVSRRQLYLFFRGLLVIIGGFLVHLSLGTIYTFGNIAPYIVSYIRNESHPANLQQGTTTWIFAFALIGQGGSMFLGGWMVRRIGPRWTTLIGGWVMSLGVCLTYFTIKVSFWLVLLTYGFMFGVGVGIAYIGPLSSAMKWLPKWKGFANGIVVSGFGLGALIFNVVQTFYVNPSNKEADFKDKDGDEYFTDQDLLHRVPNLFLILGGSYAVMQLVGSLLLTNPPEGYGAQDAEKTPELDPSCPYREVDDNSRKERRSSREAKGSLINTRRKVPRSASSSVSPRKHHSGPELNDVANDDLDKEKESEDEQVELLKGNRSPTYSSSSRETSPDTPSNLEVSVTSTVSWSANVITSLKPWQMLKKLSFYMLWLVFLFNGMVTLFTATLYKFFGLGVVTQDDHFLAIVGSVSAIFNCLGRIFWGTVADRVSYKFALVLISGIMTIFLLTMYACTAGGKGLFLIWVCVIFFCIGGNFSVFPTAIARAFGIKYVSVNYGLLFTSQIIAGCVGALLSTVLKTHVGYSGLFFLISGISAVGLLLALLYRPKRYISLVPN